MDIQKYPSVMKDCDEGKTILGHYGPERPVNALPCIRSIIQKKELTDLMRPLKNSPVCLVQGTFICCFYRNKPKVSRTCSNGVERFLDRLPVIIQIKNGGCRYPRRKANSIFAVGGFWPSYRTVVASDYCVPASSCGRGTVVCGAKLPAVEVIA